MLYQRRESHYRLTRAAYTATAMQVATRKSTRIAAQNKLAHVKSLSSYPPASCCAVEDALYGRQSRCCKCSAPCCCRSLVAPAQAVSTQVCAVLDQAAPGGDTLVASADVQEDLLGNPPFSEQVSTGKCCA